MSTQPPGPPPMQPVPAGPAPGPGPGRKWYVIALLVFLLFFVPSLLGFLKGLDGITNGLTRVVIPGEATVDLEAGTWTIFYEHSGEFEGETFSTSTQAPGIEASVTSEDGEQIPVSPSFASFEYNIGGHTGFSIGEFKVPEEGTYVFSAQLVDPNDPGPYLLALGKDLGSSTILLVVGIIGMIGGAFIGFVIWLIVIILRSRAKKRAQMAGYAG